MKHATLITACLLSSISHAQVWAPTGATWHYGFFIPFNTTGYVHFEAVGDTMIDGQATRKITRTTHYYNGDTQQYGSSEMSPVFSHADAGIVWIYVPDSASFDTLYNFNAGPGDRWQLAPMPQPVVCYPESRMDVVDTGTTLLNGVTLRWLAVEVHYIGDFNEQVLPDTIVERIGSTAFYMLPHDFCNGFVDGAEGGGLFCYQDAQVDYLHPLFDDCVNGLGLEAGPVPQTLSIYPNPGNVRIQFSCAPDGRPLYVRLTDPLGRIVAEGTATRSDGFDVSSLPTGLFHCTIKDNSGVRLYSGPWMKQ